MGWIKRKEAEFFADQVEEALDTILSGRELKNGGGYRGHPLGKMRGEILAVISGLEYKRSRRTSGKEADEESYF